jgi:HrpA-like RNA helicase
MSSKKNRRVANHILENKIQKMKNNKNNKNLGANNPPISNWVNNTTPSNGVIPFEPTNQIGILDPEGIQINPFTREPYKNLYNNPEMSNRPGTYAQIAENWWTKLPVYTKRNEIINLILENQVLLVTAGTGSGKTALIPKLALHALGYDAKIMVTVPKIILATETADSSAQMSNVILGEEIGYSTGPQKKFTDKTKIIYATDGTLTQKLTRDPLLKEYDMIIVDEAHERGINIDLILLGLKKAMLKNKNLKLIVMSATAKAETFINYFKDDFKFHYFKSPPTPNFPVDEIFLEKPVNKIEKDGTFRDVNFEKITEVLLKILLTTDDGAILVFVTGSKELDKGCQMIEEAVKKANKENKVKLICKGMASGTSKGNKDIAISNVLYKEMGYNRKVVFATEVVESSITIDGLKYVIDTGMANKSWYDPAGNINMLKKKYIAKANHTQRKGRVGRTQPGTCYNLFTEEEYEKFMEFPIEPMLNNDLINYILKFLNSDEISHTPFPFKYKKTYPKNKNKNQNKNQNGGGENDDDTEDSDDDILKNNNRSKNRNDKISLDNYLNQFLTRPLEEYVQIALVRLYALNAFDIKDGKAILNNTGNAIHRLVAKGREIEPEMAKCILAGYNYRCRDEMCEFAGMIEASGGFKNITDTFFPNDYSIKRIRNKNKQSEEFANLKKIQKKMANKNGDVLTLIDSFEMYKKIRYSNSGDDYVNLEEKERKEAELNKKADNWCKENYISNNAENFRKAFEKSKAFKKELRYIINDERASNNSLLHNVLLFAPQNTFELEKSKGANITMSLLHGYYTKFAKQVMPNSKDYVQCFPAGQTNRLKIDKFSIYEQRLVPSTPKYAIYMALMDVGQIKMQILAGIPETTFKNFSNILNATNSEKFDLVKQCLTSQPKTQRNTQQRSNLRIKRLNFGKKSKKKSKKKKK